MKGEYSDKIFLSVLVLLFSSLSMNLYSFSITVDDSRGGSFLTVAAVDELTGDRYALWDEDADSSGWVLNINGNPVTPSENRWNRDYRDTESGYRLTYSDRLYTFETKINIYRDAGFFLMTATFTNNSDEKVEFEPSLLLDTSLGESTGLPFKLPDGSFITGEKRFEDSDIPAWIGSIRSQEVPALYIFPTVNTGDRPLALIAANWLRLKESGPDYEYEEGRSFDNPPFSEDDSAVLIRYRGKMLGPGESRVVAITMGLGAELPESESFESLESAAPILESERFRLREYTLIQRLRGVQAVLDELDYLLNNTEGISNDAVSDLEDRTSDQEMLRGEYENL